MIRVDTGVPYGSAGDSPVQFQKRKFMGRVKARASAIERARKRGDAMREKSLTMGHSQAMPEKPKEEPKRRYKARDGSWKDR